MSDFCVRFLGEIPYMYGLEVQTQTLEKVIAGEQPNTFLVCTHPDVLTCGRATKREDLAEWSGEVVEVSRGGRLTYHGPGQIIVYPIVHIVHHNLHAYLQSLEDAVVEVCQALGVPAESRKGLRGVWIYQDSIKSYRKMASIGVAIRRWVTYHGLAFNYKNEFTKQGEFRPCGFSQKTMIGLCDLVSVPRSQVESLLVEKLKLRIAAALSSSYVQTKNKGELARMTPVIDAHA